MPNFEKHFEKLEKQKERRSAVASTSPGRPITSTPSIKSKPMSKKLLWSTQKATALWKRNAHDRANGLHSPYKQWLQQSGDHAPEPRRKVFATIGKSPVETPARLANLAAIQEMSARTSEEKKVKKVESDVTEGQENNEGGLRRTFSKLCCQINQEQGEIRPFDALSIYFACAFFNECSYRFVNDLLWASGARAWQGTCVPSKSTVYKKDDLGHSLYVIGRGTAEVILDEWVHEEVHEPGYFGELQLLGVLPRRHQTVRAKTSLHIFEVTFDAFTRLLHRTVEEEYESCGMPAVVHHKSCQLVFPEERRHFEIVATRMCKESIEAGHATPDSKPAVATEIPIKPTGSRRRPSPPLMQHASTDGGRSTSSRPFEIQHVPTDGGRSNASRVSHIHHTATDRRRSSVSSTHGIHHGFERSHTAVTMTYSVDDQTGSPPLVDLCLTPEASQMQARSRLMSQLVESLRSDLRQGCMMPADAMIGHRCESSSTANKSTVSSRSGQRAGESPTTLSLSRLSPNTSKLTTPMMSRMSRLSTRATSRQSRMSIACRKMEHEEDEEEEHSASDNCNPLDLDLLPPVPWLSTRQKQDLLRELHVEVRECKSRELKSGRGSGGGSRMGSHFSSVMSFLKKDERSTSATNDGDAVSAQSFSRPDSPA